MSMVHVILASHGTYASGLREAAEMIMGEQEHLAVLGLYPGDTLESFYEKIAQILKEINEPENVLILTDLRSGTPFNAAIMAVKTFGCVCVSGMNLPLILDVLSTRDESKIDEVVKSAVQNGREGICDSLSLGIVK